jgi:hypothetical protein
MLLSLEFMFFVFMNSQSVDSVSRRAGVSILGIFCS